MKQATRTDIHEILAPVSPSSNSNSNSSSGSGSGKSEHGSPPRDYDCCCPPSPASPDETTLTIVSFEPNDPDNPHNWSTRTKSLIFLAAFLTTTTTSYFSTLSSNFSPPLPESFAVLDPSGPQKVLPASLYLAGAPLSESPRVGRWRILVVGAVLFVLVSIGQAVVDSWAGLLILRFLAGVFGSPPVSVFGGVIADLYKGEVIRGRVMMYWSATTFVGPLGAPIIAGFASEKLGWRAVFWISLSLPVASLLSVVLMPETLASTILRKRAARLNKEYANTGRRFVAPADLKRESAWIAYRTTLARPWQLLFGEMVVSLSCIYLGFIYAVFYMLVQIFPAVFQGLYGFSPGMSGILFTIMGLGTAIGSIILLWYDGVAVRLGARHPSKREEYLRLPLACAGGPIFVMSMLWLGWSARADIHWLVPLASVVPYGVAYHLIYVAIVNYVADAYGIYSASALAAMSMTRSVAGTLLPLAIEDMLAALGIGWSCTLLAGTSALLALVPFGFIAYGERIRAASRFSTTLKLEAGQDGSDLGRVTSLPAV
ncbi:major facilitator superfamily domain-containing protein [Chaetomium strumarium]|uniref:Major facilitator superfamily domain-containing protein n=1 Tax=Chaetomium strumarium TaxID=1170767 RepID=A0AAJ0GY71_9PEZI|nr:major facilitator superfamily domain-containing protein [Chaetomium strumarium]